MQTDYNTSSWKLYGGMMKSDSKAFIWKPEYGSDFFFFLASMWF